MSGSFLNLFVQLRQCVAGHSLSSLGSQQPVEILDHVLATELCSLPVRDQHATALHNLRKHTRTHNYNKCIYVAQRTHELVPNAHKIK